MLLLPVDIPSIEELRSLVADFVTKTQKVVSSGRLSRYGRITIKPSDDIGLRLAHRRLCRKLASTDPRLEGSFLHPELIHVVKSSRMFQLELVPTV
jgi:hypothetical protein